MSVLRNRRQAVPETAVSVAGQEAPVQPAYNKNASASPVSAHMGVPSEPTTWNAPVVYRGDRMNGIRHMYARGATRQPISPLGTGTDLGVGVWSSEFQPDLIGPIHDAGFNDALFQAGYPGFNFGLSFKVQNIQENATGGPGFNMRMQTPSQRTKKVNPLRRPSGAPGRN